MAGWQNGLCRGLQILLYRFDSGTGLQRNNEKVLAFAEFFCYNSHCFQRSSVVEQSAVNRLVVGSSPTAGANFEGGIDAISIPFFMR